MAKSALDKLKSKTKLKPKTLVGKQKNLDVNKNGKLDAQDFKMLRSDEMAKGGQIKNKVSKVYFPDYIPEKSSKYYTKNSITTLAKNTNVKISDFVEKNVNNNIEFSVLGTKLELLKFMQTIFDAPDYSIEDLDYAIEMSEDEMAKGGKTKDFIDWDKIIGKKVNGWEATDNNGISILWENDNSPYWFYATPGWENEKNLPIQIVGDGGDFGIAMFSKNEDASYQLNDYLMEVKEIIRIINSKKTLYVSDFKNNFSKVINNGDSFKKGGYMAKGGELSEDKMIQKLSKQFEGKDLFDDEIMDEYEVKMFDSREYDEMEKWKNKNSKKNYVVPFDSEDDSYTFILVPKNKMAEGGQTFNADYWEDYYTGDKKHTFGGLDFKTGVTHSVQVLVKNQIKKWNEDNDDNIINVLGISDLALEFVGKKHYISNSIIDAMIMQEGTDVDLFEDYEDLPSNVKIILEKYEDDIMNGKIFKAKKELNEIGYTFDAGFGGGAENLRKIKEKGGMMAKGGKVLMEIDTHKAIKDGDKIKIYRKELEFDSNDNIIGEKLKLLYSISSENEDDLLPMFEDYKETNRILMAEANSEFGMAKGGYMADGGELSKYIEVNGTYYQKGTPQGVIDALESARNNKTRVKIFSGDPQTGRDYHEEYDTMGTIGRSTGSIKIPLLISTSRSSGGGAIMTKSILKIRDTKTGRVLYQASNYKQPNIEIVDSTMEGYSHELIIDGDVYSRHKTKRGAELLKSKLMADGGMMAKGGTIAQENNDMLQSNIKEIKHHADELKDIVTNKTEVEPWVIAKTERASTDLSDVTHYLDGEKDKSLEMPFEQGGKLNEDDTDDYARKVYKPVGVNSVAEKEVGAFKEGARYANKIFADGGELSGLTANIYRSNYDSPTNKMYGKSNVTIIDEEVPEIFKPDESRPAVRLIRRKFRFGSDEYEYIHAVPYNQSDSEGMFGGTFIYSSDSRFPSKYPIPLHDRVEMKKGGYMAEGGNVQIERISTKKDITQRSLSESDIRNAIDDKFDEIMLIDLPKLTMFYKQDSESSNLINESFSDIKAARRKIMRSSSPGDRLMEKGGYMAEGGEINEREEYLSKIESLRIKIDRVKNNVTKNLNISSIEKKALNGIFDDILDELDDLSYEMSMYTERNSMKHGGYMAKSDMTSKNMTVADKANRFLQAVRIADNDIKLKDITVEASPRGNWVVFEHGKVIMTVNHDMLDEETIRTYNLEHHNK